MRTSRPSTRSGRRSMQGAMLIEALVAILVFSIGILGLVGLQGTAVNQSSDARYRFEAAQLADQVIGEMWTSDRTLANLQTKFNTCATAATCTGYTNWATVVAARLPGVALGGLTKPTVNVDASGIVVVSIYWRAPSDDSAHQYSFEAQIAQ
jgi:type IV pilus assembly protein PilV